MIDRKLIQCTRPALAALMALALIVPACAAATGEDTSSAGKKQEGESVATIGGKQVTRDELETYMRKVNPQAIQQYYEARRQALEQLLGERIMEAEAASRGTTPEALQQEILGKAVPVTEADVEKFYNENKSRMGGQTLDAIRERIQAFLLNQNRQQAVAAFMQEGRKKQAVAIHMEPPRADVKVGEQDPSKGPAGAPIQIVEFSDFQCPFCSRVGPTLAQVTAKYGDKVRIVFRDFPLTSMHPDAQGAAEAANCAAEQGKFWEYHDRLFQSQQAQGKEHLKQYAAELGLKAESFNACVDSGKYRDDVLKDLADGQRLGVTGTPAFFVNGRFLSGAQPYENFAQIIDEELKRSAGGAAGGN